MAVDKEKARERMRQYRLAYPERTRATDIKSWHKTKKWNRKAKRIGDRKCVFCKDPMSSKMIKIKQKKYCDTCLSFPEVRRYLSNLYMRRWRQKKKGLSIEPIRYAGRMNFKRGRPAVKSIIIRSKF